MRDTKFVRTRVVLNGCYVLGFSEIDGKRKLASYQPHAQQQLRYTAIIIVTNIIQIFETNNRISLQHLLRYHTAT